MIICNIAEVLIILALGVLLARENQRRDKLQEGVERDLDSTAFSDLTDNQNVRSFLGFGFWADVFGLQINFRYIY